MKFLLLALFVSGSVLANAAPVADKISAFVNGGKLYVTVLGGSCNRAMGELIVDSSCRDDRKTRNGVVACSAQFLAASSMTACPNEVATPYVVTIDLKESHVDAQARTLFLIYGDIELKLNLQK